MLHSPFSQELPVIVRIPEKNQELPIILITLECRELRGKEMEEFPGKYCNICSHHSLKQHFGQNPFNLF